MTLGEKYEKAAIDAVRRYKHNKENGLHPIPRDMWNDATSEIFGYGTNNQKKGCPRAAFLGLCQNGDISGIPEPPDGSRYTISEENKRYAIDGLETLRKDSDLEDDPKSLWETIPDRPDTYTYQMHVVTALWRAGLIKRRKV